MSEIQKLSLSVVHLARENDEFRKVLWTGDNTQLVLMAIPEGGEIGFACNVPGHREAGMVGDFRMGHDS